jgi:hypothetical protein
MQAYIDPKSKLVKAVLVDKATRLATAGLEQLLDEAEAQGLRRDEALAICNATIEDQRERDESNSVFQRLREALKPRSSVERMDRQQGG